ncbi:hypothetical protein CcI49_30020 [Frankia sp. CcI49]|uniref:hypothetical protein n=1 Tax=Frankia sp. CcI49 TaxID=1745382 RepID=UPI0009CBEC5C|nr:hypothetical protein [Frankia sp. CcI49]ONH54605.1 hypothetical protein CcI49_30020 [Frankia sp. CcI49]
MPLRCGVGRAVHRGKVPAAFRCPLEQRCDVTCGPADPVQGDGREDLAGLAVEHGERTTHPWTVEAPPGSHVAEHLDESPASPGAVGFQSGALRGEAGSGVLAVPVGADVADHTWGGG